MVERLVGATLIWGSSICSREISIKRSSFGKGKNACVSANDVSHVGTLRIVSGTYFFCPRKFTLHRRSLKTARRLFRNTGSRLRRRFASDFSSRMESHHPRIALKWTWHRAETYSVPTSSSSMWRSAKTSDPRRRSRSEWGQWDQGQRALERAQKVLGTVLAIKHGGSRLV